MRCAPGGCWKPWLRRPAGGNRFPREMGVVSANFDDYNPIRLSEIPDIEVYIVKSNEKIGGIGEPGVPPTAPAVANAVFNATGARVRRIPLTSERVLAAIKKA